MKKKCDRCKNLCETKSKSRYFVCKVCRRESRKREYIKHKEKIRQRVKEWELQNKAHIVKYRKEYLKKNRKKLSRYKHGWYAEKMQDSTYRKDRKAYRLSHRKEHNRYNHDRMKNDMEYRLTCNLRKRMCKLIRKEWRGGSAVKDLGCSVKEFKKYIEKQFGEGMSWNNYGEWHIDHILPLKSFDLSDREQFKKAAHYTNLQPLWAEDNIRKSDNIY